MAATGEVERGLNLYQKLVCVRSRVGAVAKDKHNEKFNFDYVSASALLSAIRPLLDEFGLFLKVQITDHELEEKWRESKERDRAEHLTELEIEFTWINSDKPEETLTCTWYGQGLDSGEKGVGKAVTYALKYFLLDTFQIPTDLDDPDGYNGGTSARERSASSKTAASRPGGTALAKPAAKAAEKPSAKPGAEVKLEPPVAVSEIIDLATFAVAFKGLMAHQGITDKEAVDEAVRRAKAAVNLGEHKLKDLDLGALKTIYSRALKAWQETRKGTA